MDLQSDQKSNSIAGILFSKIIFQGIHPASVFARSRSSGNYWSINPESLKMMQAGSIKFLGFVNPEIMPILEFRFQLKYAEDGTISCSVVVSAQDKAVCSFKGTFHY